MEEPKRDIKRRLMSGLFLPISVIVLEPDQNAKFLVLGNDYCSQTINLKVLKTRQRALVLLANKS